MTIRILVADDQHLVRAGFRMVLSAESDMEVVAEAADGASALSLARETQPDVCLVDIRMPPPDGLEVTRRLAGGGRPGAPKVVVVTTFDLDEYVYTALSNGASGFLLKDAGPALLTEAVRAAVRGDAMVAPQITLRLLQHFTKSRRRAAHEPAEPLTDREEEVIQGIARGLTNPEIAAELYIAPSTVKTHLGSVQAKLGLRNRVEIAAWAFRTGRAE
ncbi:MULTISPECIES: response regulator [Streptomyces]|uniref:Response regulator transcription factor n=3 Tax=Streptomyces rhizosphaericus TaxID=114699 RepID=A0ABN1SDN2_9ACTN|nr:MULTISPECIES: response regulator transcription factor [Streptomyces]MBI0381054.1 response regulator transcription factor [Streptomyces albiflaviniger]EXU69326.1 LuxR family transcriptional regulator [Streptomyces sp. PRh5]MBA6441639.1 response regulator transcription factor [Streptomyces sp. GMR22]NEW75943.1 response regulator transcription factor [Streptomyces rhizosphaericus]TMU99295.1 response regulator transcription factor [Streptomyces sp. DASNCL29]